MLYREDSGGKYNIAANASTAVSGIINSSLLSTQVQANSNSLEVTNPFYIAENSPQRFFKENYIKAMEIITPPHYFEAADYLAEGSVRSTEKLINSHILFADNIAQALPISSVSSNGFISSIGTIEGISKFFVKQNGITNISPMVFEQEILVPLGKSFEDFSDETAFRVYLSATLPSIRCVHSGDIHALPSGFGNNEAAHGTLSEVLSWVYFLNRADPIPHSGYSTSGELINLLADKLTGNKSIVLSDCLKVLQSFLWYNKYSQLYGKPVGYTSGAGEFVSGTQQLDAIKTLVDVVYSPAHFDAADVKVRDSFDSYISSKALIKTKINDSSFYRFMEAVSFYVAETNGVVSELETLTDIDRCPDSFLPYLADLIGWDLIGYNPIKWRLQLKNAVEIYKAKGTKKSIQLALNMIFGPSATSFNSGSIIDLWESYIPNIIMYSLITESSLFYEGNKTFTEERAISLGIQEYDLFNPENNVRSCVDRILLELSLEYPNNFALGTMRFPGPSFYVGTAAWGGSWHYTSGHYYTGEVHSESSLELSLVNDANRLFSYRGKVTSLPPFEEERYYLDCQVDNRMANAIVAKLLCYGVNQAFADEVLTFLKDEVNTVEPSSTGKGFLLFTNTEQFPPNYDDVVSRINTGFPDPINYTSLWNSKSSFYKTILDSASFDFSNIVDGVSSAYAVSKIFNILQKLAPAHAIPDYIIQSSSTETVSGIVDAAHPSIAMNPTEYFEGSGALANNFLVSSWSMSALGNTFSRVQSSSLVSGAFSGGIIITPRSTLRKRDFTHLLPRNGYSDRTGFGVDDYIHISGSYVPSSVSSVSLLGFIGSSNVYKDVALITNPYLPMMNLISYSSLHDVWGQCENLNASSQFFGVNTSSTYPCRGLNAGYSLSAIQYTTRDQLNKLMALQHRVLYHEKQLQAYEIFSAFFRDGQQIDLSATFPSALGITPSSVSAWTAVKGINLVRSLANHLEEKTITESNTNKYDCFKFGNPLHFLYRDYTSFYTGNLSSLNINGFNNIAFYPNIISHTYGPYLYNANLYEPGSAYTTSSQIVASALDKEFDISHAAGKGILSDTHVATLGTIAVSATSALWVGYPEYQNSNIVSGVTLIDSSGLSSVIYSGRTFSVFKFPASSTTEKDLAVPLWARNDMFSNNMAIKYQRIASPGFPRIRFTLNPAGSNKNFLLPNHKYRVKVVAVNLNTDGNTLGGDSLCVWIHTNPISNNHPNTGLRVDFVWSYVDGRWVSRKLSTIQSTGGINTVINELSQRKEFLNSNVAAVSVSPHGVTCIGHASRTIEPPTEPTVPKITNDMFQELAFDFSTDEPTGDANYNGNTTIQSKDTVYHIDLILKDKSSDRFIVLDSISVEDLTHKEKSIIVTDYGDYNLNKEDLQVCFKYFNDLRVGIASRVPFYTSGMMLNVSGGSRASYRTSFQLFDAIGGILTPYGQVSAVDLKE